MKKKIFSVFLLLSFSLKVFSQDTKQNAYATLVDEDGRSIGMVLLAGLAFSSNNLTTKGQVQYNDIATGLGIDVSAGFFGNFKIFKGFSFQPELLINGVNFNNFSLTEINPERSFQDSLKPKNGFTKYRFALPLLLKIALSEKVYFYAGPKIDYQFSIKDAKYQIRDKDLNNSGFSVVVGFEYKLSNIVKLNVRYNHNLGKVFNTDGVGSLYNLSDHYLEAGLLLAFARSSSRKISAQEVRQELQSIQAEQSKKDKDLDGVLDDKDKCPTVEGPASNDGCPIEKDSDKDGVVDSKDKCLWVPGVASNNGCPLDGDRDRDGVIDSKDDCPEIFGLPSNKGCPLVGDRDKDGVIDTKDDCPDIPGDPANKGCPLGVDKDKDGIIDSRDACPDIPGDPSNRGCPLGADKDKDGIIDAQDACPTVAGPIANSGCPIDELKKVFSEALKGVQFETGKSIIKPVSFPILDKVIKVLSKNPSFKHLKIEGHTDNVGNPEKNLALSKDRAKAVKDYLVKKGIPSFKLISSGYGSIKPTATNDTQAGRDANRRVVFELVQ